MTDDNKADARRLERDIRETQDQIGDTVSKLEEQLSPKKIVQSLFSDDGGKTGEYIEMAKRNPIAAAMIGGGLAWLMSGKTPFKDDKPEPTVEHHDGHHRSYVDHMSRVEQQHGEEQESYSRRRDMARANYFMLERGHDEDDKGFRQRLDEATSSLRDRTSAFGAKASDAASSAGRSLQDAGNTAADAGNKALGKAQEIYKQNPLVGGLLMAALGAAVGAAVPISEVETEKLGAIGDQARAKIAEGGAVVVDKAKEKVDALSS